MLIVGDTPLFVRCLSRQTLLGRADSLPVSLQGVVVPVVGQRDHQADVLLGGLSNRDVKSLESLHSHSIAHQDWCTPTCHALLQWVSRNLTKAAGILFQQFLIELCSKSRIQPSYKCRVLMQMDLCQGDASLR